MTAQPESRPGWWRPPMAVPGNTAALKHGADSDRMIEARAALVRSEILEVAPWLAEPEFAPAVARWLRAEARSLMLHDHIAAVTARDGAGKVAIRLWEQVTAADRLAAQLGNVLGLDPLGKARLRQAAAGAEMATASLADVIASGRTIIEAQEGGQ
jgi:hypothetical protein